MTIPKQASVSGKALNYTAMASYPNCPISATKPAGNDPFSLKLLLQQYAATFGLPSLKPVMHGARPFDAFYR
ncbi:hypothetical protein [Rhizobium sp. ZPR3]|uniref:Uncharacterized protein n=2 Tax=unclassified Rhizobium TaxID=2613769 RepID=A0AAU7SF87_9HYPH